MASAMRAPAALAAAAIQKMPRIPIANGLLQSSI